MAGSPNAENAVLFLAHGTITDNAELPEFLRRIRHGRAASPELIADMARRYDAIGGSPLLKITLQQCEHVAEALGLRCEVAMRLSSPSVAEILPKLLAGKPRRICLFPLAPFSVQVYVDAAKKVAHQLHADGGAEVRFVQVDPWGCDELFIRAHAKLIEEYLAPEDEIIFTAHSLPTRVIEMGDNYANEVEACVQALRVRLARPATLAYQSQGADGGNWLGPDLNVELRAARERGATRVLIAPIGFLGDHVETMYDLDIDAQNFAKSLGLSLVRVPALNTRSDFIRALVRLAQRALAETA